MPAAVDAKLDRLVTRATDAGERTSRKELLAAIVASCDLDGDALGAVLKSYRLMTVRDVLPAQPADAAVVHLADHQPGPRAAGS